MGIFDFLKKQEFTKNKTRPLPDAQTIYFKNGKMYRVYPTDKESWYDARYLISDGVLYDLEKASDIRRIPIPNFDKQDIMMERYGVTGSLDYVLRMKAGSFYNRGEAILCSVCLWKSTEMMFATDMWKPEDYDRLINWQNELGLFDEAKKAEKFLNSHTAYTQNTFDRCAQQLKEAIFQKSKEFGTDLVVFHDYGHGCCEKCAPLRGRVYSISGKSKVFPALPRYVKEHGNFHSGCRCSMSLFFEYDETIYFQGVSVDAIKASNRPWIDDRSTEEIESYKTAAKRIEQANEQRKWQHEFSLRKGQNRLEFIAIQKLLPDMAPKSLTGYTRMKNAHSKNFLKLADIANQKGITIKSYK